MKHRKQNLRRTQRCALDAHTVRRVAVEALCDIKTVARYLNGVSCRPLSARRIEAALVKLGLGEYVREAKAA